MNIWDFVAYISLFIFTSGTSAVFEVNEEDECGSVVSDRIVGGINARLGQYPWLARLGYNRKEKIILE